MTPSLDDLLRDLDARIRRLEQLEAPLRDEVVALLQGIDALHRSGLTRLLERLRNAGAEDLVAAAAAEDEAVRVLLALYELVPLDDAPAEAAAANVAQPDALIELPMLRPTPTPAPGPAPAPLAAFRDVADLAALTPGRPHPAAVGGTPLLLLRLDSDQVVAFEPTCPSCALSLEGAVHSGGVRSGGVLVCPWSNCAFDLRSGRRADGDDGPPLRVYAARVRAGRVEVRAVDPAALAGTLGPAGRNA